MSQNLYRVTTRMQIVDPRTGLPTGEFARWLEALFARVGGFEGFSNQELFGEAASPDYRDEMLARLGNLEAQLRGTIDQAQQVLIVTMEMAQTQERVQAGTAQDNLVVKGAVHLNATSGRTLIGNPTDDGSTRLQVDGDLRADNIHAGGDLTVDGTFSPTTLALTNLNISGNATIGGQADIDGELTAQGADTTNGYSVAGTPVVGPQVTGWGAPTGVDDRSAYAVFTGLTASPTYDPAQLQTLADELHEASGRLAALIQDARTHGLIGD